MSLICIVYYLPKDFELELPSLDCWVDNSPPSRLGIYEKAFNAGLRFPIFPFILEFHRFYGISQCSLTLNSIRFIVGLLSKVILMPRIGGILLLKKGWIL